MSRESTIKSAILWTIATIITPFAVSWVLAGAYLGPWYARTGHRGSPPPDVLLPAIWYTIGPALWLTVGLWWFVHRKKDAFSVLFSTRTGSVLKDVILGLALGGLWVVAYGLGSLPPFAEMFILNAGKIRSVPASLSAGFCEEFLFRGFVILIIARAGGSKATQIIMSSLAFGLAHFHWGPYGMLWTTLVGLTLAGARTVRGNVWPAVIAHSILDLCIEPAPLEKAITGGLQ